jgi:hypothetical protein
MSTVSDILEACETVLRASTSFKTADIFQREEIVNDGLPDDVSIYLFVQQPRPDATPMGIIFRVYPVNIVVAFLERTRAKDENEPDVVNERRAEYSDAVKTALAAVTVQNLVSVDWAEENLMEDPPELAATEVSEAQRGMGTERDVYRIKSVWNFMMTDP